MAAAGPDLGVLVPSLRPALAHSPSVRPSRLIIGFISKQYVCRLLSTEPDGTFLLRFSDSEIGGVTIAHVIRGKDGEMGTGAALGDAKGRCHRGPGTSGVVGARRWTPVPCLPTGSSQVENIQPFSAKDLSIRSLGDRIRDLGQLRNLYPNTPKDQAFGSHYNSEWVGAGGGPGLRLCLPRNAAGGWEGRGARGPTQVLLAPELAGVASAGTEGWPGPVLGWRVTGASLRAEEQTGKDGRGYVSTAIKMTVESERWVCV